VTSSGTNDSGMFETYLHEDRFLPFEGAGAISRWNLALPGQIRAFDYSTISDVILHVHYTAREAGNPLGAQATKELAQMLDTAGKSSQALVFCLRYDFPTEWSAFINGTGTFQATLETAFFLYMVQGSRKLPIDGLTLYAASGDKVVSVTPQVDLGTVTSNLALPAARAAIGLPADPNVLIRNQQQQVFMMLQYHFGAN
jgi:Tc toxin complex TcA C-terminal TcB-binding domain